MNLWNHLLLRQFEFLQYLYLYLKSRRPTLRAYEHVHFFLRIFFLRDVKNRKSWKPELPICKTFILIKTSYTIYLAFYSIRQNYYWVIYCFTDWDNSPFGFHYLSHSSRFTINELAHMFISENNLLQLI